MAIVLATMFQKKPKTAAKDVEAKPRGSLRWATKKCHPYKTVDDTPSCCKARLESEKALPQYELGAPDVTISHRFIDRPRVRMHKLATIVGGHKVPFSEVELDYWKADFEHKNTLTAIAEEDKATCECCMAVAFSSNARNVCIALTKVSRRRRA
ncbi:hypothetical protein SPRG_10704 [Saprolegnia parasitica CBS 223.65]|uniref:Uncharacterized protein n=1 Tax=Saprolegnia parasitica (strain CBS 223.65) TaxID=695850 RepID=A0A067C0E4_SAPPC|nr:hypothetical protein SPRG_10704 [Saprolegnia parasitica CBS 223.65]KDO24008.1 hypothetical protein SPRG_10704 [Saprolegnia parasitica CBS 223.65]|eukprot:XP_012205327.1 hypothetical protein SPRG_10704 [Saprolegnia parasitica CBS 223.65]